MAQCPQIGLVMLIFWRKMKGVALDFPEDIPQL